MKRMSRFCISTLFILILIGCITFSNSPGQTQMQESDSIDIKSGETESNLDSWLGMYQFYEFSEPNINMLYKIEIFKDNSKYFANIIIDGFQTSERIKAIVLKQDNAVEIIFKEYLQDNAFKQYKQGDLLLKLLNNNSEILTEWGELKPILRENSESGNIYFRLIPEK